MRYFSDIRPHVYENSAPQPNTEICADLAIFIVSVGSLRAEKVGRFSSASRRPGRLCTAGARSDSEGGPGPPIGGRHGINEQAVVKRGRLVVRP